MIPDQESHDSASPSHRIRMFMGCAHERARRGPFDGVLRLRAVAAGCCVGATDWGPGWGIAGTPLAATKGCEPPASVRESGV